MSRTIEECTARAVDADWDEASTRDYNLKALGRVWGKSRAGKLTITPEAVEFLDWKIRCADIDTAVLTYVRAITPAYFLRIKAKGKPYQFGVEGRSHFLGELPFSVRRESTEGFTWLKLLLTILSLVIFFALVLWPRGK